METIAAGPWANREAASQAHEYATVFEPSARVHVVGSVVNHDAYAIASSRFNPTFAFLLNLTGPSISTQDTSSGTL
jgi:hypothetical protein